VVGRQRVADGLGRSSEPRARIEGRVARQRALAESDDVSRLDEAIERGPRFVVVGDGACRGRLGEGDRGDQQLLG